MLEMLDPTKGQSSDDDVPKEVNVIDSKDLKKILDFPTRLPILDSNVIVAVACIDGDSEIATLLEAFYPRGAEGRRVRTFLEGEATNLRSVKLRAVKLRDVEAG